MKHSIATALMVALEADRPGTLARATQAIGQAGINLDAVAEIGGQLHVLTADSSAARQALEAAGFRIEGERQVLVIDVEDRPRVAAGIFGRIADRDVNVDFTYVAMNNRIVVGASDLKAVAEILARPSMSAVDDE